MEQVQLADRIRAAVTTQRISPLSEDSFAWMGGEASVGTQATRYLRRQEGKTSALVLTVLGLTFLGGLAVGSLVSSLLSKPRP